MPPGLPPVLSWVEACGKPCECRIPPRVLSAISGWRAVPHLAVAAFKNCSQCLLVPLCCVGCLSSSSVPRVSWFTCPIPNLCCFLKSSCVGQCLSREYCLWSPSGFKSGKWVHKYIQRPSIDFFLPDKLPFCDGLTSPSSAMGLRYESGLFLVNSFTFLCVRTSSVERSVLCWGLAGICCAFSRSKRSSTSSSNQKQSLLS